MRISASAVYVCTFPDFEESGDRVEIEEVDPRQAAIKAAGWWEESIDDYRVLRGEETLRIQVQAGGTVSAWEVRMRPFVESQSVVPVTAMLTAVTGTTISARFVTV